MSYCRWSTDNFKCDLYMYEYVGGGYTIHVAANRRAEGYPKKMPAACFKNGVYRFGVDPEADRLAKENFADNEKNTFPINLPHAGESFNLETLEEARDKMLELMAIGYRVPAYVIDNINEEIEDGRS